MLNSSLPATSIPRSGMNLPAAARPSTSQPTGVETPPAPAMTIRVDKALPLVVTEFRSADGRLSASIPTPREIEAYRKQPPETSDPMLDKAE